MMTNRNARRAVLNNNQLLFFVCTLGLIVLGACTPNNPPQNNNDNESTGGVEARVVSFVSNFAVSELEFPPPSVLYTVEKVPANTTTTVTGRIVQVADNSPGAQPIADPVEIATNLPTGTNRSFSLCLKPTDDPNGVCSLENIGVGFYRVQIVVSPQGFNQTISESTGVVQIQGPPDPVFIQPVGINFVTEAIQGETVLISFDVGDPEGDVQWRLFYLTEDDSLTDPADRIGTQLATGTGNVGTYSLATSILSLGDYQIGISATDSGSSIAATVASGRPDLIVTIPADDADQTPIVRVVAETEPVPPTIAITSPGAAGANLFRDQEFTIQFTATAGEPGANPVIELVVDSDTNFSNGFVQSIASSLPITVSSYPLPTDLPEGEYYIGAQIDDRINPPVTAYSAGTINIVREVTLEVTSPDTNLPLAPSSTTVTNSIDVEWSTNLPPGAGTVDVFARAVSAAGQPFGAEIPVLAPTSPATMSAEFSSQTSGLFEISVRLRLTDGTVEALETAPQYVRVSSLPAIVWVGSFADEDSGVDGAIFQGVNFEDNAGTSFTNVGDINGDGFDDFVINARYGKPFFTNPTGIGPGEAYLIYGSTTKFAGEYSLNSVGTSLLRGVTFTGIRTPQSSNETDGMSTVTALPDLDNDGRSELMFSFPKTDSRGHNVNYRQDGASVPEENLCTLEKSNQFLRGGVVIVSSQNTVIQDPDADEPTILLDLVGQDFLETLVLPEPLAGVGGRTQTFDVADVRGVDDEGMCAGECEEPTTDEMLDSVFNMDFGFNPALSDDFIAAYGMNSDILGCASQLGDWGFPCGSRFCGVSGRFIATPATPLLSEGAGLSGFYPTTVPSQADPNVRIENFALEPFGARIIGIGMDDGFGTSVAIVPSSTGAGEAIVSAPNRTARGILFGVDEDNPEQGGEVDGLESGAGVPGERASSGVAYLFSLRNLWEADMFGRIPPKPHQYMIGQPSHFDNLVERIPNIDAIRIAGQSQEKINNILGIEDFNGDGRNDFAIGSPTANSNAGRVYVAYRRQASIEGDYVLEKLAESPTDPDRLDGVLIISDTVTQLGASLASGIDFNGDGQSDLIIGAPGASNGVGEVIVVFGDGDLVSSIGGVSVTTLLNTRNAAGQPRAARITGLAADASGNFGFNLANAGDINGDGSDDLIVAAPNASPRFDSTPTNSTDSLSDLGIDSNFNGIKDDVSGPLGLPDGVVDSNDNLLNAGLVYVIYGSNRLDQIPATNLTINIDQLGTNRLRGFMIAGRRAGYRLGGGDAGDTMNGGINAKQNRGRSFGISSAGDVDNDGRVDLLLGSILADPRIDAATGVGVQNGGEAYLLYGSAIP